MIIATAGHVDHGKTQLVRALTGVDTDTLAEEKRRGLSIDIGFAYLPVQGKGNIAFMDVPGHERFIKNALCGLTSADFVLLLVAADDGPMPQTLEHLSIIDLLEVRRGAIVISKIDRVPQSRIDEVDRQIGLLVENTTLQNWPKYSVSSVGNRGINNLQDFLVRQAKSADCTESNYIPQANFRMPIDRFFEKKGVGLIVTGTIQSGIVRKDDRAVVAGTDKRLRVRGMHIQNTIADHGREGQRCALNLTGPKLRKELIGRGVWIVDKNVTGTVSRFDARIKLLSHCQRKLRHWTAVHLHIATFETTARVALLEKEPIEPGQSALVQIVCDSGLVAASGDQFILRDNSARYTLGGGRVIDIFPPRRGRAKPDRIQFLRLSGHDDAKCAVQKMIQNYPEDINLDEFAANWNLTPEAAAELFAGFDKRWLSGQEKNVAADKPRCHPEDDAGWLILAKALDRGGVRGLLISELAEKTELSAEQISFLLTCGVRQGLVVKLSDKLLMMPRYLKRIKILMTKFAEQNNNTVFSITDFRQVTGLGRNRAIEILECFDRQGITRRDGRARKVLAMAERRFDQLLKRVK